VRRWARLAGDVPQQGRGAVTGGVLRHDLRLKEVERSEEGRKFSKENT
jgi:hypothetical protein